MSKIEVDTIDKQSGSTLTLGGSGTAVTLASGATQTGFGRTGTVDWNTTPKTSTFTAVSGDGFFANTSGGAFSMNLPAGSAGAIVSVADYAATWQTNNLTVVPNGSDKIGSLNENATLDVKGQSVTFIFVDSTQGWINTMDSTSNIRGVPPFITATGGTITTVDTNFKVHTFTGPGTFTVNNTAVCAAHNIVSYVVVAGGGAGGQDQSGGGGAGGFREGKNAPVDSYTASPLVAPAGLPVSATGYPITVGAGGAGAPYPNSPINSGAVSTFSSITSAGGGGGGSVNSPPTRPGQPGGSGGGGSQATGSYAGGTGNTPPVSPAQGTNGGANSPANFGGGGGGAGEAGNTDGGGYGGDGVSSSISGSSVARAGGGGGPGGGSAPEAGLPGGDGGGGTGAYPNASGSAATTGDVNTGGGGGGATGFFGSTYTAGSSGGSGVVIIRYKFQ